MAKPGGIGWDLPSLFPAVGLAGWYWGAFGFSIPDPPPYPFWKPRRDEVVDDSVEVDVVGSVDVGAEVMDEVDIV